MQIQNCEAMEKAVMKNALLWVNYSLKTILSEETDKRRKSEEIHRKRKEIHNIEDTTN